MRRELRRADLDLAGVQRWMQAVIVHPGDVDEAVASPDAARELDPARLGELVRPSWSLSSAERVEIYHDMYPLRMVEALESDFPGIRHTLGEEGFEAFVAAYVADHPSRSYTLNRLGDHVPQFFLDHPEWPDSAFLHDLARLELAITQVFDEEETPTLGEAEVRAVPAEAWASARLRPIKAFRLLALRHPATQALEAARQGWEPPRPTRKATWVVVYRQRYSVMRLELSRTEHELLSALAAGEPLGEAIAAAARKLRSSRREETVFRWFRSWLAEGLFSAIEA